MKVSFKFGSKRHELAKKLRKTAKNFKLSRDIREDRARKQTRLGKPK